MTSQVEKAYALKRLYSEQVSQANNDEYIHIHDLHSPFKPYCARYDALQDTLVAQINGTQVIKSNTEVDIYIYIYIFFMGFAQKLTIFPDFLCKHYFMCKAFFMKTFK